MKKIMSIISVIILGLMLLTGCGKKSLDEVIVGSWRYVRGVSIYNMTFSSDGTYIADPPFIFDRTGNYEIEDSVIKTDGGDECEISIVNENCIILKSYNGKERAFNRIT